MHDMRENRVAPHDPQLKVVEEQGAQIANMEPIEQSPSTTTTAKLFNSTVIYRTVPEKPHRQTNLEIQKLQQAMANLHDDDLNKNPFWTSSRRENLSEISSRVFVACTIAGTVLVCLAIIWLHHFTSVYNIYPVNATQGSAGASTSYEPIEIISPFINDIKGVDFVFIGYLLGTVLLLLGSYLWKVAKHRPFKCRHLWYLGSILTLLASIVIIVAAPLMPLLASNSPLESETLKHSEYDAYKKGYKGTIKFFQSQQCDNPKKFTSGKDTSTIKKMEFFCDMLSRLVCFLYFLQITAVIPFLSLVFCLLEVIVNKKRWDSLTIQHYKPRTAEQKASDKSKSVTKITMSMSTELDDTE